ncbi:ABC transporter ATP-binding protein [Leuconostoc falkenbergense]|uniref:ABC transporter ATP-binding protein n=1 Tax=Leuconostoc falkenbergense TaxID=2766470 RepID=UPI0021AABE16|nr:ABC transporter ATP-binding protein [Leuconostoc falkenbergense]MCT4377804.1 ABC transporter ATP-binding protein [Leuconostoc falkenbergense]MDV8951829.1 ATP-binding cassette domain-containing protein [Leuconostoc falkenbergense]
MLKVKHVTKKFGDFTAISDVSFDVKKGEIVGFIGPNGSGKSTTIDLILGLTHATSGQIEIAGEQLNRNNSAKLRQNMSFLSTDMNLDRTVTGRQALTYFANLRHVPESERSSRIDHLAGLLNANLDKPIKKLSRGNRQKISLIAALLNNPKLLVMDEPTSGFDPVVQNIFIDLIHQHKKNGGAGLISSHNLSEVAEICDRVVFIVGGKIVANKEMAELQAIAPKHEVIDLDAVFEKLVQTHQDTR